eukprot:scaffold7121_cov305-Pinguiococcus_pyrenoidosus.AAC.1
MENEDGPRQSVTLSTSWNRSGGPRCASNRHLHVQWEHPGSLEAQSYSCGTPAYGAPTHRSLVANDVTANRLPLCIAVSSD